MMGTHSLKPFVPSEVCLQCDGCCRYTQADSIWRPKLGQNDQQSLGEGIDVCDVWDSQGYIKTIQEGSGHVCRFLNSGNNICGIYAQRPFECFLYPFILSQTPDAVKVYAHLSCPYVQDNWPGADFDGFVEDLKGFFSREDVREFFIHNKAMFHAYTAYTSELLYLFDVPG